MKHRDIMNIMMLDVGSIREIHHLMFFIRMLTNMGPPWPWVASGKHSAEE